MRSTIPSRKASMPSAMSYTSSRLTMSPPCVPPPPCTCWRVSSSRWASRWCSPARVPTRSLAATSTSTRLPRPRPSTKRPCASSPNSISTTACAPTRAWPHGAWRGGCPSWTRSFSTWPCAPTPRPRCVPAPPSRSASCARPLPISCPMRWHGVRRSSSATAWATRG